MHLSLALLVIAQLATVHPRRRSVEIQEPVAIVETDAGQQTISARGHEPSGIANALEEPAVLPAREPRPIEHAPWYVYGLLGLVALLVVSLPLVYWASGARHEKKHGHKRSLPKRELDKDEKLYDEVIHPPHTGQEYVDYVGSADEKKKIVLSRVLAKDAPPRTNAECKALYLAGVEELVQRMVWPEKVRCAYDASAPIEMRHRVWLGESWDRELVMRATGKEKGQALKSLLRKYKENGGVWISHAILESTKTAAVSL